MSHTCYFVAAGHFSQTHSDGFKWRLFALHVEFGSQGYVFCRDYLFRALTSSSPEEHPLWDLLQPGDAVVILADVQDPGHRTRMDALAACARERGIQPRFCLAP